MADDWRTPETDALIDALLRLEDADEAGRFLRDLCTLGELRDLAQRWAVVRLLDSGMHYAEISRETGASTATITRIASWLHHGEGGYRLMLERTRGDDPARRRCRRLDRVGRRAMRERLRLAVPNKGRLVEPTLSLLHDAGLVFEEHDRSLVSRVQNHHLDILFVRTGDVIEFVGDGVADLGITGGDLLAETGAELPVVRELGYGRCRLAAAVPSDSPYESIADLAGRRVATSHPNVTRRFFAGQSHRRRRRPAVGRRRGRPAARRRRRDRGPRVDRLDARDERAAADRRHPRLGGGPRRQPDGDPAARGRARRDRDDAGRGDRGPRPQVPDDERAGRRTSPSSRRCCRASSRRR